LRVDVRDVLKVAIRIRIERRGRVAVDVEHNGRDEVVRI
jgi:hypothetical protein